MLKVTCAIIFNDSKILITQNGPDSDHPYQWEFPGGKMHEGESAESCIKREIKEELEIKITIMEKLKPVVFDYGFKMIELIPFICSIKSGNISLNDHVEYVWIDLEDLKNVSFAKADEKLIDVKYNFRALEKYTGKKMHNSRKDPGPANNR